MSNIRGDLITIVGCFISLTSFCFLPYLIVPYTSFTFTGWQLVFSGPAIPLPHYFPHLENVQGVLRNVPFVWAPLALTGLMGIFTGINLFIKLDQGGRLEGQKSASCLLLSVCLILIVMSLYSLASKFAAGFNFIGAHADTLSGVVNGSLFSPGFLGLLIGAMVIIIGGVVTLRSER